MGKNFNVEIRDRCKVCGLRLPNARYRTFCSKKCRDQYNNKKTAEYRVDWYRKKRDEIASIPDPENKCQCLICGKWYVQVSSHVYQVHEMTYREYLENFKLKVKIN